MTVLDKIIQMQAQGMQDYDIAQKLREEGASPKDINDAMNQAKVKAAVNEGNDMQQSMMPEQIESQTMPAPPPPQEYAPDQGTSYYDYYNQPQATPTLDTDTITEIAEQVVMEKFNEFNKRTGDLISFRNDVQEKLKDINERVSRIEDSLDKIQQAIIGKVRDFDENASYIRKDLENIHGTMSKLMNPLVDTYQELKKMADKK